MCFCVAARALSTVFAFFPAPFVNSLVLLLISACRRSNIGRTWPLRVFAVSAWEFEIPCKLVISNALEMKSGVVKPYLRIPAYVVKHGRDAPELFVKVVPFFERV